MDISDILNLENSRGYDPRTDPEWTKSKKIKRSNKVNTSSGIHSTGTMTANIPIDIPVIQNLTNTPVNSPDNAFITQTQYNLKLGSTRDKPLNVKDPNDYKVYLPYAFARLLLNMPIPCYHPASNYNFTGNLYERQKQVAFDSIEHLK